MLTADAAPSLAPRVRRLPAGGRLRPRPAHLPRPGAPEEPAAPRRRRRRPLRRATPGPRPPRRPQRRRRRRQPRCRRARRNRPRPRARSRWPGGRRDARLDLPRREGGCRRTTARGCSSRWRRCSRPPTSPSATSRGRCSTAGRRRSAGPSRGAATPSACPTRYGAPRAPASTCLASPTTTRATSARPKAGEHASHLDELGIALLRARRRVAPARPCAGVSDAVIAFSPRAAATTSTTPAARAGSASSAAGSTWWWSPSTAAPRGPEQHVPPGPEVFLRRAARRPAPLRPRGDRRRSGAGHRPRPARGPRAGALQGPAGRLLAGQLRHLRRNEPSGPLASRWSSRPGSPATAPSCGGKVHPALQERPGGPRWDPAGAVIPLIRRLSQEDFGAAAPDVATRSCRRSRSAGA